MSEEQFDYSLLDETTRGIVRQQTDALHAVAQRTAHGIIEIGQRLNAVKAQVGHGHFGPWLRAEFGWSQDTAGRFMAVAQKFGHIPHGAEFAPKALYLLAAPDAPAAARAEALDRAGAGERVDVAAAEAIIQAHRPTPPAYAGLAQLASGVRAWVGRQAPAAAGQIALLQGIRDRTTAGLIALDALLAGGDLPGPRRKPDVLLALGNVLDELGQESGDSGQAETGDSGQESVVREQRDAVEPERAGGPASDSAPIYGLLPEPVLLTNPPVGVVPPAQAFPLTIGGVTIVLGDSRRLTEYVAPGTVHLAITSPPYNVAKEYATHDDNLPAAEYWALLEAVFAECHRVLVAGGRIAVIVPFGVGRKPWTPLAAPVSTLLTGLGFTLRGIIIWDKSTCGNRTSWGSYRLPSDPALRDRTEAIVVAHKGNGSLPLPAAVVQHDARGSYSAFLPGELFLALTQDLWQVAPESAQRIGHPAPFPVELAARLIRLYGYPGCHVVDPFAGSGTVGVAARQLGCRATLVDIDAGYCALAARRCAGRPEPTA